MQQNTITGFSFDSSELTTTDKKLTTMVFPVDEEFHPAKSGACGLRKKGVWNISSFHSIINIAQSFF